MSKYKRFYVIDCSYHFRASFFALPPIYSPRGELVNAVYGFVSMLLKILKERNPDALVVADDALGDYFRHELFPSYKSEKKRVPEECNQQMPILHRILDAMDIKYLNAKHFEADDVIATLTLVARQNNYHTYICSKDKDLQQLLNEDVTIVDVSSGDETTPRTLKEQNGLFPNQIPDLLALTGDKVDSIPGIPGIGPKTAIKLLKNYATLENILRYYKNLNSKLCTNIGKYYKQALLAKRLTSLRKDVPIPVPFKAFEIYPPDRATVKSIFYEFGFERLLKRIEAIFWQSVL